MEPLTWFQMYTQKQQQKIVKSVREILLSSMEKKYIAVVNDGIFA